MKQGAAFRGQPLLLLAGLLAGWMGLRVALWQPPFEAAQAAQGVADAARALLRAAAPAAPPSAAAVTAAERLAARVPAPRAGAEQASRLVPAPREPIVSAPLVPLPASPPFEAFGPVAPAPELPRAEPPPRAVIGHNLLLMAGLSQMEVPPALLAYLQAAQRPVPGVPAAAPLLAAPAPAPRASAAPRWSADAWLLVRRDGTTPLLSGRPSYGRSQAGGVIRYRLASAGALRPQAYLRASTALAGAREQELAAGVSARLLPAIPLRFAAEARAGETARGTRLRPAVYAVTEFPPLARGAGAGAASSGAAAGTPGTGRCAACR